MKMLVFYFCRPFFVKRFICGATDLSCQVFKFYFYVILLEHASFLKSVGIYNRQMFVAVIGTDNIKFSLVLKFTCKKEKKKLFLSLGYPQRNHHDEFQSPTGCWKFIRPGMRSAFLPSYPFNWGTNMHSSMKFGTCSSVFVMIVL